MIYLETLVLEKFWFLIKEPLISSAAECLLTITTLNLRDILHYACNGCNLWQAKIGLPKFYFRQPLGNPTYASPNLATLANDRRKAVLGVGGVACPSRKYSNITVH